jgi:hypothetical protein
MKQKIKPEGHFVLCHRFKGKRAVEPAHDDEDRRKRKRMSTNELLLPPGPRLKTHCPTMDM